MADTQAESLTVFFDDDKKGQVEGTKTAKANEEDLNGLVQLVNKRFEEAKTSRLAHEKRWLTAYRNYRGLYSPEMLFNENEQSRVFVKITKTKTLAAYGQLMDVLLSDGKFPLSIEATEKPTGTPEAVHVNLVQGESPASPDDEEPTSPYGYKGDGKELDPGFRNSEGLTGWLSKLTNWREKLKKGPSGLPQNPVFFPADEAAQKMEKKIHDQLGESNGVTAIRMCALEACIFGTGAMKGPFTETKTYHKWTVENGVRNYDPEIKDVPRVQAVSIWGLYPDPNAVTSSDVEWLIERHSMTRSQLRGLKRRPFFRKGVIDDLLFLGNTYTRVWWETQLTDDSTDEASPELWEVLEYWGTIDTQMAKDMGLEIPKPLRDLDEVQVNCWLCNGQVLRLVMNPFQPQRIPYMVVPYEVLPYQLWGVGVPENMHDSQTIMNGHVRMAIDNLALAGHMVFEVDETMLAPGQDYKIYSGKIFRRQGGVPGQSIFAHKFPNTANENLLMFDRFRQFADEETGMPSYSHGYTGVTGQTRTASGMSMLMQAASLTIKTVVKNFDDYLLRPLGEALFAWNMQFDPEEETTGDLAVKARGTASLMQREVRSQRLLTLMQVGANPNLAPHIKWPTVLKEFAKTVDIDPEKFLNSPEEALLQAELTKGMENGMGSQGGANPSGSPQSPGMPGGAGGMANGATPNAASSRGDGQIDGGSAPMPGETGFSSSGGQSFGRM